MGNGRGKGDKIFIDKCYIVTGLVNICNLTAIQSGENFCTNDLLTFNITFFHFLFFKHNHANGSDTLTQMTKVEWNLALKKEREKRLGRMKTWNYVFSSLLLCWFQQPPPTWSNRDQPINNPPPRSCPPQPFNLSSAADLNREQPVKTSSLNLWATRRKNTGPVFPLFLFPPRCSPLNRDAAA